MPGSSDKRLPTRYWIELDRSTPEFRRAADTCGAGYGCGVTAYDYDDALRLLNAQLFRGDPMPPVVRSVEHVDVSTLDPGHILPNMGVPIWRGIWYPNIGEIV